MFHEACVMDFHTRVFFKNVYVMHFDSKCVRRTHLDNKCVRRTHFIYNTRGHSVLLTWGNVIKLFLIATERFVHPRNCHVY